MSTNSTPTATFYQQRAKQFQKESEAVEKQIRLYAWLRVGLVVLIGLIIYLGLTTPDFYYTVIIPLAGFIVLVRKQTAANDLKERLSHLSLLNQREAKALDFNSIEFNDGQAFADVHHPYSYDLDLFGPGSVFQYLNRCGTYSGEIKLAHDLKNPTYNQKELQQRQEAVRELAAQLEMRQQVWATGKQINDAAFDVSGLLGWLNEKPIFYKNKVNTILRWVLPAITVGITLFVIFNLKYFGLFFFMMTIQLAIAAVYAKRIGVMQNVLVAGGKIMHNYAKIFELLSREKFSSEKMQHHHAIAVSAYKKVKEFSGLVNALESRMNPLAMQLGNGLFLYDFHTVSKLEKWREENGNHLPGWLESLAEWDSLLSLGTLHYNYPGFAFAEVMDKMALKGEAIGHLLIPDKERVDNNFEIGNPQRVYLITGANMAGKSTFLRALGVNFVLAQIGSPVCARVWQTPLLKLRTGMRTTDSLQEHQSYFFAELNRLQAIVTELEAGIPMFILLDEILKGTNSTDKQLGSLELLKRLKEKDALTILATHDIALGILQEQFPKQIATACFEGKIENDQLTFEYKLHPGVAQKANATFLMRKMGII
jgi:DNA mismatch repair ATPase MutS